MNSILTSLHYPDGNTPAERSGGDHDHPDDGNTPAKWSTQQILLQGYDPSDEHLVEIVSALVDAIALRIPIEQTSNEDGYLCIKIAQGYKVESIRQSFDKYQIPPENDGDHSFTIAASIITADAVSETA